MLSQKLGDYQSCAFRNKGLKLGYEKMENKRPLNFLIFQFK